MAATQSPSASLQRRQFLSGDVRGRELPLRPPWAIEESIFDDVCNNCGDCIEACPTQLLSFGRGRLPLANFAHTECTFCGDCETVCKTNALTKQDNQAPWNHTVLIADNCLSMRRITCRSCSDVCEPDAISFRLEVGGKSTPEISLDDCTGCGACIAPCPTQSITAIQIHRST